MELGIFDGTPAFTVTGILHPKTTAGRCVHDPLNRPGAPLIC